MKIVTASHYVHVFGWNKRRGLAGFTELLGLLLTLSLTSIMLKQ